MTKSATTGKNWWATSSNSTQQPSRPRGERCRVWEKL